VRGEGRGVDVHLDDGAAAAQDLEGEIGGRVDHGGGADHQHQVAALRLFEAGFEEVARDRLPEHYRIALHDPAAAVAARRPLPLREVARGAAAAADDAAQLAPVAVDLGECDAARLDVEVVDVLGDGVLQVAAPLQLGEGEVAWVGSGLL